MKILFIIIFLILLTNYGEAQQEPATLTISRDSYASKETLQAEFIVNIDLANQVTTSNFFLTDEFSESIPLAIFMERISKNYYIIYFNIPELSYGKYNFEARDVRYIEDDILKQFSVKKTFMLLNQSLDNISVSVKPGVILEDGKLEIINNNLEPVNITIEAPLNMNLSKKLILNDRITLNVKLEEKDYFIKIIYANKNYLIPVLAKNISKNETIIILNPPANSIIFLNSSLGDKFPKEINIEANKTIYNPLYIKNNWNFPLSNLSFTLTGNLKEILTLDKFNFDEIQANGVLEQIVIINENKNLSKDRYKGAIVVSSKEGTISYLNLDFNIVMEELDIIKNETKTIDVTYYNFSNVNQTSNKVKEEKKGSTFIKIFIILLVLATIIYFIFKRKIRKEETFGEHFYKFKKP